MTKPRPHGYGVKGRGALIHRWVIEQIEGPIPEGKVVMHLCGNRACYRYSHLKVGTQSENIKMARDEGAITGQKFTAQQVDNIRCDPRSNASIASDYGCTRQNIWKIKTGKTWA